MLRKHHLSSYESRIPEAISDSLLLKVPMLTPSTTRVAQANANAVDKYKHMRAALLDLPDSERLLCDIVITAQLALLACETPFKIHAIRLFEQGVSKERLQHVVLSGLGVTLLMPQVATALDWIDEAHERHAAAA
jgi:alkylhydroperoxidase/carboxymuconolactone decarboxylase family protein YurZ